MDQEQYKDLLQYKDGVWSFMLEHCRILPSGKMRVIFDMDNRLNFEKRVWSRYKNYYHRGNPEMKQAVITAKREEFVSNKQIKRQKYLKDKAERKSKALEIKKAIAQAEWYNRLPKWRKYLIKIFTMKNRYRGFCFVCHEEVEANQGVAESVSMQGGFNSLVRHKWHSKKEVAEKRPQHENQNTNQTGSQKA